MTYGVNAPLGLVPYSTVIGAPWTGLITEVPLQASYGTSIFRGDLVTFASGVINIYTPANAAGSAPAFGVFLGINYQGTNGFLNFSAYWPANTAIAPGTSATAIISADPNTLFDIQSSAAGITTAQINKNATVVFGTAGNVQTELSGMSLDTATNTPASGANSQNYPLHIYSFTPVPGNTTGVQYNNVLVKLNNTSLNAGATGV
jgi:hypothetical protein